MCGLTRRRLSKRSVKTELRHSSYWILVLAGVGAAVFLFVIRDKQTKVEKDRLAVETEVPEKSRVAHPADTTPVSLVAVPQALDWRSLESEKLSNLVQNLRRAGCPEQTVHDIVRSRLNRRLGLDVVYAEQQSTSNGSLAVRERHAVQRRLWGLEAQFEAHWRELFGTESPYSPFHGVSIENQVRARGLAEDYAQQIAMLRGQSGPFLLGEARLAVGKLEAERLARLTELLGPKKAMALCMQDSSFAPTIVTQLAGMSPTEDELHSVYRLRLKYLDAFNPTAMLLDGNALAVLSAKQKEMENELKMEIGEARYKDYYDTKRADFRAAFAFASRNGLDRQTAVALAELQRSCDQFDPKALAVPGGRQAAVEGLRGNMVNLLGEQGMAAYLASEGAWFVSLTNRIQIPGLFQPVGRPTVR